MYKKDIKEEKLKEGGEHKKGQEEEERKKSRKRNKKFSKKERRNGERTKGGAGTCKGEFATERISEAEKYKKIARVMGMRESRGREV